MLFLDILLKPRSSAKTVTMKEYHIVYSWYEEKLEELQKIRNLLEPYAPCGQNNEYVECITIPDFVESVVDIIEADRKIIKQLQHEQEGYRDQLDKEQAKASDVSIGYSVLLSKYENSEEENELLHNQLDMAITAQLELQAECAQLREKNVSLSERIAYAAKSRTTKKKVVNE